MELASAHDRPERISHANTAQGVISSSGITFRLWRLYQHSWLVALVFPLFALLQAPGSPARVLFGLGGLAFFAVSYTWLMWPHPVSRGALRHSQVQARVGLLIALVVLALVLSFSYGLSFLWLFMGVSACAGVILPSVSAFVVVSLLMMLPVAVSLLEQGSITRVDWPLTIALVLLVRALGLDMIGVARMGHAIRELHNARRERARLAVAEERLRVARDLHDLLGHALSMIALKSELAWRTIEQEPAQAAREIQDVEKAARQVLREVRTAVAGYRHPTLLSELEGAQQLLEAAGIEERVDLAVRELPAAIDAVLAWVVREGVTNVVRHSRARWCSISLTEIGGWVCLVITNDDRTTPPHTMEHRNPVSGNGLPGLVERVVAQGGHVEAGPKVADGVSSFRLQVELPLAGRQEKTYPGIVADPPDETEVTP